MGHGQRKNNQVSVDTSGLNKLMGYNIDQSFGQDVVDSAFANPINGFNQKPVVQSHVNVNSAVNKFTNPMARVGGHKKYTTPSVADSTVQSQFAAQKNMSPEAYGPSREMYGQTGMGMLPNGSADGVDNWYNPMDWGRDFGDDRMLENGMDVAEYNKKFDANGKPISGTDQLNTAEAAYYDRMGGTDYLGMTNTAIAGGNLLAKSYDQFFGDSKKMNEQKLKGMKQNIAFAAENQQTERDRRAGIKSMFA